MKGFGEIKRIICNVFNLQLPAFLDFHMNTDQNLLLFGDCVLGVCRSQHDAGGKLNCGLNFKVNFRRGPEMKGWIRT